MSEPPECRDEVCLTCSDRAVPARVVRLLEHGMAVVAGADGLAEASVALVTAVPGDTVLLHAGEAIAVLPDAEEPAGR
ncbi:HypC/HybG/HupF family hydrogenase formation chaperone [Natronosporangium hydrolyticum]|uniref:HypC/HybG/HupF family hydrogenase formation chaperone n=1 Tax=Natronosporangium hydrolyticum TaxID=2811111 RepID=A0A895YN56_9ACTN|nr:HypC/HybG/HupF family hydrogenase formation chaperone [Natronosporangium hydrolyticum]QSB16126.1 HypC/HybG/HupF family hydrogenase formation chaperone [Natronosporangium hydrolyticum]